MIPLLILLTSVGSKYGVFGRDSLIAARGFRMLSLVSMSSYYVLCRMRNHCMYRLLECNFMPVSPKKHLENATLLCPYPSLNIHKKTCAN